MAVNTHQRTACNIYTTHHITKHSKLKNSIRPDKINIKHLGTLELSKYLTQLYTLALIKAHTLSHIK